MDKPSIRGPSAPRDPGSQLASSCPGRTQQAFRSKLRNAVGALDQMKRATAGVEIGVRRPVTPVSSGDGLRIGWVLPGVVIPKGLVFFNRADMRAGLLQFSRSASIA